jgi:CRP-like cAMP-binding protein
MLRGMHTCRAAQEAGPAQHSSLRRVLNSPTPHEGLSMPKPSRLPCPSPNALIDSLPQRDRDYVIGACVPVEIDLGETLCRAGEPIRYVYFPTRGYISLISAMDPKESLEIGMVGDEGMFGATLLLDVNVCALRGLVQGSGSALRMSPSRFRQAVNDSAAFRRTLNRYVFVLMVQVAQTAACNRFHVLDARLARWLLVTQDRAHSATFRMTHALLSLILGVRRAGVTEAAGRLQAKGLIRYVRGSLSIIDRAGLEKVSCRCYATLKATYRQHLPSRAARRPGASDRID